MYPSPQNVSEPLKILLQQFRIMIAYAFERGVQVSFLKLCLECLHEHAGLIVQTAVAVMNRTAGALRISAKNGQQHVTFGAIGFDAIHDFHRDFCATSPSGVGIKGITNRISRSLRTFETERGNLWAGHLKDTHLVFMTKLQQFEIHRWELSRPCIARVLIEDAIDDGDEASASDVIRRFAGSSSRLD